MSDEELESWRAYNELFPLDDVNRIYKPASVIASSFGGKQTDILTYLCPEWERPETDTDYASQIDATFGPE